MQRSWKSFCPNSVFQPFWVTFSSRKSQGKPKMPKNAVTVFTKLQLDQNQENRPHHCCSQFLHRSMFVCCQNVCEVLSFVLDSAEPDKLPFWYGIIVEKLDCIPKETSNGASWKNLNNISLMFPEWKLSTLTGVLLQSQTLDCFRFWGNDKLKSRMKINSDPPL